MSQDHNVGAAARQFQIDGDFLSAAPYGSGHINDSYCAVFDQRGQPTCAHPAAHQSQHFQEPGRPDGKHPARDGASCRASAGEPDSDRRVLTLIPARDGQAWHVDRERQLLARISIHRTGADRMTPSSRTQQAFQAAKAFGQFQQMLADLPAPRLHDTIPDFHHTPKRFLALWSRRSLPTRPTAPSWRRPEIEFALAPQSITSVLLDANLPERVTHNDTKFNNVMLDDATGEGICVIDLDTVMPGLALYDFGDMVRTTTSPGAGRRAGPCPK